MMTIQEQAVLTTWEEFLALPQPEDELAHYELHDGDAVLVSAPKPIHVLIQLVFAEWLYMVAQGRGRAAQEFSYRPAANLQFWRQTWRMSPWGIVRRFAPTSGPSTLRPSLSRFFRHQTGYEKSSASDCRRFPVELGSFG